MCVVGVGVGVGGHGIQKRVERCTAAEEGLCGH